ncbi:chemotaxis protein CheW [Rhodobacter sp. NSM]|uniref:chemotaxis protein CheW n=1 Tax=Rhodobacter sp. NSM TaxID=3457501 RepID=UPI003FD451B6
MAQDLTGTASIEGKSLSDTDNVDNMYLTFALGGEEYGVGIGGVTEIVGMQRIMGVPDVPAWIKGVINLRGKVIPLLDVRLRFGMPERAYDERTVIIVLDVAEAPVGLIVDGVSEVLDILPAQIDRPGQFGRGGRSPVMGLARVGERVTILLDAEVLVADGDLALPADLVA